MRCQDTTVRPGRSATGDSRVSQDPPEKSAPTPRSNETTLLSYHVDEFYPKGGGGANVGGSHTAESTLLISVFWMNAWSNLSAADPSSTTRLLNMQSSILVSGSLVPCQPAD